MRIRTQFIVTMLLFAVVLAAISASAIITNQRVEMAREQENIVISIDQGASDLSYLAIDYMIYRESQQLERCQARFTSFSNEVDKLNVNIPEQQALVRNIQANTQRLVDVFNSVVAAVGSSSQDQSGSIDPALLQVSWSRMAVQSQALVSNASRLSQLLDNQVSQLQRLNMVVILALIGVFVAYFFINYLATQRRALKGLEKLQVGSATIGSGDLDFKFEEKTNDEIGDLARAFNRMTSDLKTVTAFKTDLEKEIDERKKTEEALRESEEGFRALNQTSPVGVGVSSADGVLLFVNPSYELILGYDHNELIGKKASDLYWDPGDRRSWVSSMKVSGAVRDVETMLKRKDGTPVWVSINASPILYRRAQAVMGTIQDISDRKKAERLLIESEEKYHSLNSSMSEGVCLHEMIYDESGKAVDYRILDINPAYETFTGFTREQAVGKKASELYGIGEPPYFDIYARVTASGKPESFETYFPPMVKYFSISAFSPGKGRFATVFTDITERKKAEEKLKRSYSELEASNKELEAFSYSVSHDLRAPLRSMEGFSSALLEDYADKLDDQGKQYLKYVQESSDLMARLIDDLLKLSRVTRSDMNREEINLSEMAWKIGAELEKAEPYNKVELNITPDIKAYGDRNLLRLVLENLLGNAWKFSSKVDSPRVEMDIMESNGRSAYFVRDNGVGFDMSYANKLFKPFQRLHKASEFPGTGIGLATVQRIIRRHGGEIWTESKVGEGATFYFTLD